MAEFSYRELVEVAHHDVPWRKLDGAYVDTARFGSPKASASSSINSAFAAPSTGGACSRTRRASPCRPARPALLDRGTTRTSRITPSGVVRITVTAPIRRSTRA